MSKCDSRQLRAWIDAFSEAILLESTTAVAQDLVVMAMVCVDEGAMLLEPQAVAGLS